MKPLHCLLGCLLALISGLASAQNSFTVTPLRVDLSSHAPAAVIDVINTSAGALTLQMQQRAWVQDEGRDGQTETRELILSPAIFTLQPGEKQVVRIALRGAPDARRERAFRVFVSEVPTPQLKVTPDASGFRVALRMDLPLFVAPLQAAAPQPSYALDATGAQLVVRNAGDAHIRYTDFTVLQAGRKVAELPIFTVLAGSERRFELPRDKLGAGGGLRVQANSNAGPIDAAVADAR
ncbi:MAG TPA: molecular chaperone [Burkholderiaceae bacterium]|nr:molecular chaperone [Burkholderiaceae bacterium]